MGIGFVLLIWAVILGCAAIPIALGFALWSWRRQKGAGSSVSRPRIAAAGCLPFVLLAYVGIAFIGYGIWCELFRGVDAGIGDAWVVPVGNGYYFCMIDLPERGYLLKGGCTGTPDVSEITELAVVGDEVVGVSAQAGYFIVNTRSDKVSMSRDAKSLGERLPTGTLLSANEFYVRHRWGWPDVVAVVVVLLPLVSIGIWWFRQTIS